MNQLKVYFHLCAILSRLKGGRTESYRADPVHTSVASSLALFCSITSHTMRPTLGHLITKLLCFLASNPVFLCGPRISLAFAARISNNGCMHIWSFRTDSECFTKAKLRFCSWSNHKLASDYNPRISLEIVWLEPNNFTGTMLTKQIPIPLFLCQRKQKKIQLGGT